MMYSNGACTWDVAVIGAGPSGIAAAVTLKKQGIKSVVVLDRESSAGGAPRHCGHTSFGLVEYFRPMTGPVYARRLTRTLAGHRIALRLNTSVTHILSNGRLTVATPMGMEQISARRVILATGARETPRSARLVSGGRMMGITTTGALQSMVYLNGQIPFKRPVIVGCETVSLSALLTCKKAGIQPMAMLEEAATPKVTWPFSLAPRYFGVPLYCSAVITGIAGRDRVETLSFADNAGQERELSCDGVLFTGQFTPESALARMGHLDIDPVTGSPATDQFGRCSDPAYFATGNILPPLNMAMNCWLAGKKTAMTVARDLITG